MNRHYFVLITAALMFAIGGIAGYVRHRHAVDETVQEQEVAVEAEDVREQQQVQPADPPPVESKIGKNENFTAALQRSGFNAADAGAITIASQKVFNLRQVRAGNAMTINRSAAGELRELDYRVDLDRMLKVVPAPEGKFSAEVKPVPSKTEVTAVTGQINDSLFKAVAQAGESPELAMRIAQIFAYDLDFYTDTRKGDTFRMVLEKKKYADGKTAGYGKILAAEYDNGNKKYQALLFHDDSGHPGYYSADGKSLQRAFLHSPLKFSATVTSHFSKSRYHPILKLFRPHMGTDYGAPVGTPVQTIGAGRVEFAGRKGGEGNMVQIAHSDGYQTMYLHLSRMFVHQGERVEIGKTIGLVGSTGLSTGPHLDFRILQRGQYKNFEKLGLPPSEPIARKYLPEFTLVRQQWLPVLRGEAVPQDASASAAGPSAATSSQANPAQLAAPIAPAAANSTSR
ncbi:MAG TPA: peptidoglycan DD-metalloendopeptidase family protein [Candidatus Acidoferrum sp.]|nr:peptidoglycan DD-metalloendopeptidase family protein [Candidatus Acidoferrum sp.]